MKKIKFLAALGALTLLTGCFNAEKLLEIQIEPPVMPKAEIKPEITEVEDELHEEDWYSDFCDHVMNYEPVFKISGVKLGNREVKKAVVQIENDHPEVFWLGHSYYGTTKSDGSEVSVGTMKSLEVEDIPDMAKELEEAAEKVVAEIPAGSDTYEKVLYVHDYIVNNTEYDFAGAKATSAQLCHSAYGCLVDGLAVCEGYAKAFVYIMNMLDIESGICTGTNHAWNYVNIDGEYYWLDATWDDNDDDYPIHTYFMFNDEQLLYTRNFDVTQGKVPECDSAENYFTINGGYFGEYDQSEVIDYISDCVDSGICEMMFGSFEAYGEALDDLIAKGKLRSAKGVAFNDVKYYRNDDMFTLRIVF